MKILNIKLTNYIGIYNGLELNEIFIDFKKCKHKTIVIKGKNGSGKSTLFKALHPLPDSNDNFIPDLPAEKKITILDNDTIYEITIKHPVKQKGMDIVRDTTKAYISKLSIVGAEELNPNGNVSSFKEILFEELSLDPNFIALSQLSSDNRGLADKSPSERKIFVNSILSNLEVYNAIHKTLSKRLTVFKSMINSIVSKIDSIGCKENVTLTLASLEDRINNLMSTKDKLIEELATHKSKIKLLDPDGYIQNSYDFIYSELVRVNSELDNRKSKLNVSLNKLNLKEDISIDEIMKIYTDTKDAILKLETIISMKEVDITSMLNKREEESNNIQAKSGKLISLQADINGNILDDIKDCKNKINDYSVILNSIGLTDINSISKDEFILGLNTVKDIKETIDNYKANMDYNITKQSIDYINNNCYPDMDSINIQLTNIELDISSIRNKIDRIHILKITADKLALRHKSCVIPDCNFIKDAIIANDEINTIGNLNELENSLEKLVATKLSLENNIVETKLTVDSINYLKSLARNIEKSSMILNKLPISNLFRDSNIVFNNILNGYDFKEIDVLYQYIEYSNIIDEYKFEVDRLKELDSQYNLFKGKNDIINTLIEDIDKMNINLNDLMSKIENERNIIKDSKEKLSNFKSMQIELDVLISMFNEKIKLDNTKNDLIIRFTTIKESIINIKQCMTLITELDNKISNIEKEITPILSDRDKFRHSLSLIDEYYQELDTYKQKYDKVDTIKKYSSPGKGIQTEFMELYMNKTISMTNELVSLLFNGKYVIGNPQINDSEFRIPCIGSGLPNNDISDMSTSEICMISMIISFVLLQQSSSKYNIIKLDEIDGGLDTENRLYFLFVLDTIIEMLNVEQCIMISHNNEMDLSNCDLIVLKTTGDETFEGNIIYHY